MSKVRRSFKTSCMLAAALGLSLMTARSSIAQVMDQVPSDALVVVKVNHISETNTKISNMMKSLGLTDLVPPAADPLNALETQMGIGPGLDDKRDAAGVLLNGKFDDSPVPPPMVILLPVSDYKAFLGSLNVVRTEGDVTVVHFKDDDQDTFVAKWGDYAAIGPAKEDVTAKHEGLKPNGVAAREMEHKDLCVYVNVPALKAVLMPKLEEGEHTAMDELEKNAKDMDDAKKKLAKVALTQVIKGAREFLNDTDSVTMGLSISPDGIGGSTMVNFIPSSYLGTIAAAIKGTDGPLLGGLPKTPYLFFGGSIQDPKVASQIFDDAVGPIMQQLGEMGDDGKKLAAIINMYKQAMVSAEGGSVGVLPPTAALGQGSLIKFVAIVKGDAEALKAAQIQGADAQNDLMKMFTAPGAAPGGDLTTTTVTPDFKTVDGVKFERVQTQVDPNNTAPAAMRASEMLNRIYGPDGPTELVGVADPKTLVMGMGLDDDFLKQVVEASKSNTDVLTDGLKSVDSQLPKTRSLAYYVAVDQIIQTALSYARANGVAVPVQLPNDLPPIGFTAGTEGSSLESNMFIPNKLTSAVVHAAVAAYQQFSGQGGGRQ